MADNSVTIDPTSVFDNPAERLIEFRGEIDGERHDFGVRYSVIEALTGNVPSEPAAAFAPVADAVAAAALVALTRSDAGETVIVSERDLDQGGPAADDALADAQAGEAEAHPS